MLQISSIKVSNIRDRDLFILSPKLDAKSPNDLAKNANFDVIFIRPSGEFAKMPTKLRNF